MPEFIDLKSSTGRRPQGWSLHNENNVDGFGAWRCEYGLVTTPFTLVFYSTSHFQDLKRGISNGSSRLSLVHKGKDYERRFEKEYSPRYLVTLAMAFAKEIIGTEQTS